MFMYINKSIPCKRLSYKELILMTVLEAGLEPARRNCQRILSPSCLPIPPFERP